MRIFVKSLGTIDVFALSELAGLVLWNPMAGLTGLPFPVEDLAWSKLEEVMNHSGLDKQSAVTVLKLVLGDPSVARMNQECLLSCFFGLNMNDNL